jgi:hypothetical protein
MEWYGNARRLVPGNLHSSRSARGSNSKVVEKLLTSKSRRKQPSHVFSALFYETHVKPTVNYSTYLASLAPGAEVMPELAYRNSCIRKAWENATPDIHQQVMEYKALSEMTLEELMDKNPDNENSEHTAKETADGGEDASGGSTTLAGDGISEGAAVGEKETSRDNGKGKGTEKSGNDAKELEVLTEGNQAASMFKSAIAETFQIKKVALRER